MNEYKSKVYHFGFAGIGLADLNDSVLCFVSGERWTIFYLRSDITRKFSKKNVVL